MPAPPHPVMQSGRSLRARASIVLLALALALPLLAPTPASAAAADVLNARPDEYWQHLGFSWRPCTTITWRPNLSEARQPDVMRELIDNAVAKWNDAIGKDVMRVGSDTSSSAFSVGNGVSTLEIISGRQGGGIGGPFVRTGPNGDEIVEGNALIWDFDLVPLDAANRDILEDTIVHEIGHAIGFLHTTDPRSPMSYVAEIGTGIDDDLAAAVRHLLGAPCGAYPILNPSINLESSFARAKELDLEHVSRSTLPLLPESVTNVIEIGVALGDRRAEVSGAPELRRAVLCRDDLFVDCLAASSLVGKGGVLLFVPGGPDGRLPTSVANAMARLLDGPSVDDVVLVGGSAAISSQLEDDLRDRGWEPRRLFGRTRYETAVAVADDVLSRTDNASTVIIARGDDPADAVTAGVIAARDFRPLIVTHRDSLDPAARDALERWAPARIVLLGGTAALSRSVADAVRPLASGRVQRVYGRDRAATSVGIARDLGGFVGVLPTTSFALLAGRHESTWALALAYAGLGATLDSPILLTEQDGFLNAVPGTDGVAPGPGRYLAELDLHPHHDGSTTDNQVAFFMTLGTSSGRFTPTEAARFGDQALLYCKWYIDDCRQAGITG